MKLTMFRCDLCGAPASQLAGWSEHHVFHFDESGNPKHVGNLHTCPTCRLPTPAKQPDPDCSCFHAPDRHNDDCHLDRNRPLRCLVELDGAQCRYVYAHMGPHQFV